jgi:hypothetical protein
MCELFDRLADTYPDKWGPSSPRWQFRERFQAGFEAAFNEFVVKEAPFRTNSLTLAEQLWPLAQYFSRFITQPNGEDCYSQLLRGLIQHDAIKDSVFASLNYECLFEHAALGLGLEVDHCIRRVDEPLPPPSNRKVRILKPHGSCNFIARVDQHTRAVLTTAVVEVPIEALFPRELENQLARMDTRSNLPIISQMSFNKEAVIAPAAMYAIRHHWREAVATSDCLVVIGVSYNPHDDHIADAVGVAKRVLYIGGSEDASKWSAASPRVVFIGEHFEDSVSTLTQHLWP